MPSYNFAIVGFGNVGRSLLRLLISKETELRRRYDVRWRLTGIATRRNGWVADPDGLNPLAVLNDHWPTPNPPRPLRTIFANGSNALAPTSFSKPARSTPRTGEPAIDHIKLRSSSAHTPSPPTKAPSFTRSREFTALAEEKDRRFPSNPR